jgi:hypothetical protein
MNIELATDMELVRSIITTPKLYEAVSGKEIPVAEFKVDLEYQYLIFKQDDKVLGCLQIKPLTKLVLDVHIFILPENWGTGIVKEIAHEGHKYIKELGYTKTFTRVPSNCMHVLHCLQKIGYTSCGMIEKGIVFNKTLVTLFLFEREL